MSKVDENAFSRKVAALEVAQNRVMSNIAACDVERRCDLIAVPQLVGQDRRDPAAGRDS